MPYIQRNWRGHITGLFANPQPDYATEELPEDHPEVIAFREKHPIAKELLAPPTWEQIQRTREESERNAKEHEAIKAAVDAFNRGFSNLEISLSALLYNAIHLPSSQVAYAIYFSPTSFDARVQLVDNAVIQIVSENEEKLKDLMPLWSAIVEHLDKVRRLRNAIAHGNQLTVAFQGKNYARLTAPAFDIIRVGRKIADGKIPGLGSNEVKEGLKRLRRANECIDLVSGIFEAFYEGNPALPKKIDGLRPALNK